MKTMNRPILDELDALAAGIALDSGEHAVELREGILEVYVQHGEFPEEEYEHLEYTSLTDWKLSQRARSHDLSKEETFVDRDYTRNEWGLDVDIYEAGPRQVLRAKYILEGMRKHLELQ